MLCMKRISHETDYLRPFYSSALIYNIGKYKLYLLGTQLELPSSRISTVLERPELVSPPATTIVPSSKVAHPWASLPKNEFQNELLFSKCDSFSKYK